MHIAFLNPQGNFDPADSHLTEHPDFGGQLVYVKQVALALGALGHRVDIVTRRIVDPEWPEFAAPEDAYPGHPGVRILRIPAGGDGFVRKEELWPLLGTEWVPAISAHYEAEGALPDAATGHYGDGGLAAALLEDQAGIPFTFTAHSLGAQKMDKLDVDAGNVAAVDAQYHFGARLAAERASMSRSAVNVTSTSQERFDQYGHRAYAGAAHPADDRRFAVIPPGVNLSVFDRSSRAPDEDDVRSHVEARLARDLDEGRLGLPVVVASSRLDPKKNHAGLVRAFAASPELQETANLVLLTGALDDPLRDPGHARPDERAVIAELREIVDGAGLWGSVAAFSVRGQAALAAAYRHLAGRGSVFALTALYEPFGLAPLEAAAAGLPVVATRNGGPSESLVDDAGEYGVLVDPEDPADVAAGLERALGSDHDKLAAAGHARVLDRYTWERTAAGYAELLGVAVADPGARRPRVLEPLHPYFTNPAGHAAPGVAAVREWYLDG